MIMNTTVPQGGAESPTKTREQFLLRKLKKAKTSCMCPRPSKTLVPSAVKASDDQEAVLAYTNAACACC